MYAACLLPLLAALTAGCGGAGSGSAPTTPVSTASPMSSTPTSSPPSTTSTRASTSTSPSSRTTTHPPTTSLAPVPKAGAEPTVRFPPNAPAVGAGANAVVGAVPAGEWARMVGYSWTSGCPVGHSQLSYVQVNFWGFDGRRSRGALVVHSSIASATARVFTRLYDLRFRIRQMVPMDSRWGHNPKGPGADDYAAMSADNTSAFNCRYVGGAEASKVYSNHAYGRAVDVNDFENPYVADNGTVYPGTYFLHRRGSAAGVFASSGSAAVRAFTAQGFRWGGLWSHPDYQHFER